MKFHIEFPPKRGGKGEDGRKKMQEKQDLETSVYNGLKASE